MSRFNIKDLGKEMVRAAYRENLFTNFSILMNDLIIKKAEIVDFGAGYHDLFKVSYNKNFDLNEIEEYIEENIESIQNVLIQRESINLKGAYIELTVDNFIKVMERFADIAFSVNANLMYLDSNTVDNGNKTHLLSGEILTQKLSKVYTKSEGLNSDDVNEEEKALMGIGIKEQISRQKTYLGNRLFKEVMNTILDTTIDKFEGLKEEINRDDWYVKDYLKNMKEYYGVPERNVTSFMNLR